MSLSESYLQISKGKEYTEHDSDGQSPIDPKLLCTEASQFSTPIWGRIYYIHFIDRNASDSQVL